MRIPLRLLALAGLALAWTGPETTAQTPGAPSILLAIADDWSSPDAGGLGNPAVRTPAFDRIAREGTRFTHAFAAAPSCTPSRAAILTGQLPHRLEAGGNLWGTLPSKFVVYPDLLERAGYVVGLTGKGWGPGDVQAGGRTRNPAGPPFPNFSAFLDGVPAERPFVFWLGSNDPHRPYDPGLAQQAGLKRAAAQVPPTLPDVQPVRDDLLDYYFEIERFDRTLADAIAKLEQKGRLQNTIVIVTSDNGRPFPRDKASVYDGGARVPLAIRWPGRVRSGAAIDALVSLSDLAPTILEAAGVTPPAAMTARTLLPLLAGQSQPDRDRVFIERERHAFVRAGNLSYPIRAVRTHEHLYVRNLVPDRWPAGDPVMVSSVGPYGDVDHGPSKDFVLAYRDDPAITPFFTRAFAKRPADELYVLESDPHQLVNVVNDPALASVRNRLRSTLDAWMRDTGDPRAAGSADPWSTYQYFGTPAAWLRATPAQTPTNFAGRWVLGSASPARAGFDAFWLGTEAVVTQTPTSVTIDRVAPAPERKAVFRIDGPGTENENVFTIDGVRHVKTSRVTLGQTLLISTETTLPDGKQWLSHINRWSMDANGDLLVTDTVICGSGECPSIVTNLRYKKK